MLLATLTGNGLQVLAMAVLTLFFAVLGLLSPANRGGLTTTIIILFVVMGMFAGYFSTRIYMKIEPEYEKKWKKNTFLTATLFPGCIFSIVLFLNFFLMAKKSSAGYPFSTLMMLFLLWFGISCPLVYLGSYYALKKPIKKFPCKTNIIKRFLPPQVWYMSPTLSIFTGGVLPFGSVFIELYFILTALWGQQFYYVFPFLFAVLIILIITCAEITIVMCYFQLCSGDYEWWWRSFLTAGCSAFYVLLYSISYLLSTLDITNGVPTLLYLGYTLVISLFFFVLTGSIGFYACYVFVQNIYAQIKID